MFLRIASSTLTARHDCTLAGITARCGGRCCYGPSYWPARSSPEGAAGGPCANLGPTGCTWSMSDRPVTCLLYPLRFTPTRSGLVLHHRTRFAKGICGGNYGQGPMLIDALRPGLAELFGAAAIDWARDEAMSGRDVHLEIPPRLLAEIHREKTLEESNTPPVLRSLPMADDGTTIPLGMFTDHGPGAYRSDYEPDDLTPITHARFTDDVWGWLKRDDLFEYAGVRGGKVRTCLALAREARHGLVTAGSRSSPQVNIVARIGRSLGLPVRAHVPAGPMGAEVEAARAAGAEIIAHRPGYNNVIIARARADAAERGWTEIPFGMETAEAVRQTGRQVKNIPDAVRRIVVPVGSGMTLAGVLSGLRNAGRQTPVVGVVVGADPSRRLDRYADPDWRERVTLIRSDTRYEKAVAASIGGVTLDPHYEAKCFPWLVDGDLLWTVGIRQTEDTG